MYKEKIGVIGGFGAYATLNFYGGILETFASESERNYPHIMMDNNFTMPSRTRALLYDEGYEEIVKEMAKSIRRMMDWEVERIVLVCGTAHYFLEDVYRLLPEAKERIVDIINLLGEELREKQQEKVLIIAAEGALQKKLYEKRLEKYGISCVSPREEHYGEIRYFIESVKRNEMNRDAAERFMDFLKQFGVRKAVLGCTEFPVLVDYISALEWEDLRREEFRSYQFFDPLEVTIQWLKRNMV